MRKPKMFKVNDSQVSRVQALLVKEKRMHAHFERDAILATAAHDPELRETLLANALRAMHWRDEYMHEVRNVA